MAHETRVTRATPPMQPAPPLVFPVVGDTVVCLGGNEVGQVVAVYDTAFKVRSHAGFQLMAMDSVYIRAPGRTTLICNWSGLAQYVLESSAAS